jgi:hypothetical protein
MVAATLVEALGEGSPMDRSQQHQVSQFPILLEAAALQTPQVALQFSVPFRPQVETLGIASEPLVAQAMWHTVELEARIRLMVVQARYMVGFDILEVGVAELLALVGPEAEVLTMPMDPTTELEAAERTLGLQGQVFRASSF